MSPEAAPTQGTPNRRIGSESSTSRTALLDAAEQLMLDQGYAAVTSRRVAATAGLKPQLVHYYFRSMDDLLLEVFRRRAEAGLARQAEALASPRPLWALWEYTSDPAGTALTMEFTALANHRKTIRAEIARYAEQFRQRQVEVLTKAFSDYGIDPEIIPPLTVLVIMTSISRFLVMEDGLGVSMGHAETREWIETWLDRFEGPGDSAG